MLLVDFKPVSLRENNHYLPGVPTTNHQSTFHYIFSHVSSVYNHSGTYQHNAEGGVSNKLADALYRIMVKDLELLK